MTTFKVVREHLGDKPYKEGDTREASEADVKHLIPKVLQPLDHKAEPAPLNKMEKQPAANKAKSRTSNPSE